MSISCWRHSGTIHHKHVWVFGASISDKIITWGQLWTQMLLAGLFLFERVSHYIQMKHVTCIIFIWFHIIRQKRQMGWGRCLSFFRVILSQCLISLLCSSKSDSSRSGVLRNRKFQSGPIALKQANNAFFMRSARNFSKSDEPVLFDFFPPMIKQRRRTSDTKVSTQDAVKFMKPAILKSLLLRLYAESS